MGGSGSQAAVVPFRHPSERLHYVADKSEHNPGIFQEAYFVNERGLQLRAYAVARAHEPRAVVVAHHGIRVHGLHILLRAAAPWGRHTTLEGSIAQLFLDEGLAVYTYDCEGHGLSESRAGREFFRSVWDLAEDLAQFTKLVRKERPGLPVFACACSLGAGICVGTAIRHPAIFDGLILAAPMVSVEAVKNKGPNRALAAAAPPLLRCCPGLETKRLVSFSKGPATAGLRSEDDPLVDPRPKIMVGPGLAAKIFCEELVRELAGLTTPFLTMHAKEDPFTDYASSELLMARAASADKSFLEPPRGAPHSLFSDEGSREWARAAVREWLAARCK